MCHSRRGEMRVAGILWSKKLSPVQLASLVAFKITRPPWYPHLDPLPPTFPALFLVSDPPPPSTPTTFHTRAPINICNPCAHYPQLPKPYPTSQKQSPHPEKKKNLTNTHTELNCVGRRLAIVFASVCSYRDHGLHVNILNQFTLLIFTSWSINHIWLLQWVSTNLSRPHHFSLYGCTNIIPLLLLLSPIITF